MAAPLVWLGQALATGGRTFLTSMATRLGTAANPKAIIAFAKENPTTAMLAAKEVSDQIGLSDVAKRAIDRMVAEAEETEELEQTLELYSQGVSASPRSRGVVPMGDNSAQGRETAAQAFLRSQSELSDEFRIIDSARSAIGSLEQLENLRDAVAMPASVYQAYRAARGIR